MRSPADMQTIQIDITNACNLACSNCTRFCGNHKKPFFMDFDTFKRAVDSLEGYNGVTGVMGGEPTLHPEFERFVLYIREKYGERKEANRMIYPQREFIKEIRRREFESHVLREDEDGTGRGCGCGNFKMFGPGLWSNMGDTYPKYYELINDSFNVQFLNDHINESYHQPGLISRKDLGIPDEEWIPMRDACWMQNEWSATITPKGAFFWEIAGALDMLFDGPGGWKIEPGWWKRKPEEFGDQLHWCEICGFALKTFMRDAKEEVDDVSPTLYEMLKKVDSPRMKKGRTNLVKIENGVISEDSKAPTMGFAAVSAAQPYIEHYEDRFNASNSHLLVQRYEVVSVSAGDCFGTELNQILKNADGWILFIDSTTEKDKAVSEIEALIKKYILNPGTMHVGDGYYFFSKHALSLRRFGFDGVAHAVSFESIIGAWQKEKVVPLSDINELTKWKRDSIVPGDRYVIWGTGLSGSFIADAVEHSGGKMMFAVDIDKSKEGKDFYGYKTYLPSYLKEHMDDFDHLLIGHYSRFEEIRSQAIEIGVPDEKIVRPYEV